MLEQGPSIATAAANPATFQVAKTRFDQGDPATGREDLAQIEQQYHAIRAQRVEALGRGLRDSRGVLEAERRLPYVLGLPMEDGMRLVPANIPTTALGHCPLALSTPLRVVADIECYLQQRTGLEQLMAARIIGYYDPLIYLVAKGSRANGVAVRPFMR